MGHITTERLDDAWRDLEYAEKRLENDEPSGAIERIRRAVQSIYNSADGVDMNSTYVNLGMGEIEQDVERLSNQYYPEKEDVSELIPKIKKILIRIKTPIEDEIHTRLIESDDDLYDENSNLPTCRRVPDKNEASFDF